MMLAPGTGVYALPPPEDELVGTLSGETGQPGADAGEVRRGEVDEVPLPGLLVDVPRGGALPPAPDRRDDVGDAAELGVDAVSHGDGRLEAGVVADDGPDVLGSGDAGGAVLQLGRAALGARGHDDLRARPRSLGHDPLGHAARSSEHDHRALLCLAALLRHLNSPS